MRDTEERKVQNKEKEKRDRMVGVGKVEVREVEERKVQKKR